MLAEAEATSQRDSAATALRAPARSLEPSRPRLVPARPKFVPGTSANRCVLQKILRSVNFVLAEAEASSQRDSAATALRAPARSLHNLHTPKLKPQTPHPRPSTVSPTTYRGNRAVATTLHSPSSQLHTTSRRTSPRRPQPPNPLYRERCPPRRKSRVERLKAKVEPLLT